MGELRSAIEALRMEPLADLPDARIEEDFGELQRVAELLEGALLPRLAELDRRRIFERDGHLSAVSWLVDHFRMAARGPGPAVGPDPVAPYHAVHGRASATLATGGSA